jgi:tetratricopeptide (TPR) repeat protein
MRLAVLGLFALSNVALAETALDNFNGSVGSASLDGDRVDVALYHGSYGSVPAVQVTIGDDQYLMRLSSNMPGISVSDRVAKEQKLDVKIGNKRLFNIHGKKGKFAHGGEKKTAAVEQMNIGGLTLTDLYVATVAQQTKGAPNGTGFDGTIGLTSLPADISWAILPSQGLVSFAADGAQLIADGTSLPYRNVESEMIQIGKASDLAYLPAHTVLDGFTVGGAEMPVMVSVGVQESYTMWADKLETKVRQRPIDATNAFVEVKHSDMTFHRTVVTEYTAISGHLNARGSGLDFVDGLILGQDMLAGYDIAMDRKAKAFILKPADAFKRKSPWAFLIAQAEKALEPAEEEGEEATTDEATSEEAEPAVAGKAADWALLRRLHTRAGNMDSALEASQNEVALDGDSCAAWSRLGQTQWASGDLDGAIESFSKSADMYHAWYDLSLEKRNELKEELDGLEGDEKENFAHTVAASSCHTADGHLAAVTLASGDLLKVESIYREHLDLDAQLPLLAGVALVTAGEYSNAQEPLRQALKRGGMANNARLALAAAYSAQGDWESASNLFQRVLKTDRSIQTVVFYLDTMHESQGSDATHEALNALVKGYPESFGVLYGWGHHAVATGQFTNAAQAYGDEWFKQYASRFSNSAELAGAKARWMSLWDASAIATQKAVRGALTKDPNNKDALLAKAAVATAKGDQSAANELTLKAAQLGVDHIGYAKLLTELGQ